MIYTKPKDMRFVDMVIWVDKNMYKDDCDDEKLYEYLYLIISMTWTSICGRQAEFT